MEDFYGLTTHLPDEDKLLMETLNRFVDEEVTPLMLDAYEQGYFPKDLIPKLANLGLFGMTLPTEYGGSEASPLTYGLACQALERGDSGLRSFISVQSALCMTPIYTFGSDAQKKRFLKPMSEGKLIGCFGLTEPDSGSDPASMKTTATPVDGGWVIQGSKLWVTNATIADVALVWAKTPDGIRGFLIEKDFEGFTTSEIKHKGSLRASITGELSLEKVFVPEENLLPGTETGLKAALTCLTHARYGIAWGSLGAAMACYDIAVDYLKSRKQFGKPLASFQLIQRDLADMLTELVKGQCLNFQLAHLKAEDRCTPAHVSLAKRNNCACALDIARRARNLLGANGISLEYHIIRHMTNLETVFTYEGTDNIHTLILGQHITGLNAFG